MSEWFLMSVDNAVPIILSIFFFYASLVLFTRVAGLRSFSKMSGFDFAVTVAIGSIFASTIVTKSLPVFQAVFALAVLYITQIGFSFLRQKFNWVEVISDNRPRLIMIGQDIQKDQLRKAKMTESDLYSKLREANVINLSEIKCVIAETTGDVSVLHRDSDVVLSPEILSNVVGAERMM